MEEMRIMKRPKKEREWKRRKEGIGGKKDEGNKDQDE